MSPAIPITFQPAGRRVEVEPGTTLLDAARQAGIDLSAPCGGVGICGACRVLPRGTQVSPPTPAEEEALAQEGLHAGLRLACQAQALGALQVDVPPGSLLSGQSLQLEGHPLAEAPAPAVHGVEVQVAPPAAHDLRSDQARTLDALGLESLNASAGLLALLSERLRAQGWKARLALHTAGEGPRLVSVLPPGAPLLGLAVDVGSTKLAAYLMDLESGATLAQEGALNPQISHGEDVISRIAYANRSPGQRTALHTRLVEAVNALAAELCRRAGAHPQQVADCVLVGNTAMHHFLCGLPVAQLGVAPYVPAVSAALDLDAAELGLEIAPGARVHLPPNIAGFVGADHSAALLASWEDDPAITSVLVDIGTNTEISLAHRGALFTCSTASGPAFEGAHIRDGMRAARGAVDAVRIRRNAVEVSTVGNAPPVGICGTGILSAVAQMLRAGILDRRGALRRDAPGVRPAAHGGEFVLVPAERSGHGRDILVTRRDVHEIQLAKGAIRAGIGILLQTAGLEAGGVQRWVIAGAFGTYLDLGSALSIGMFPPAPPERFQQAGNAAGLGARRMLLSVHARRRAAELARRAQYVELTTCADFSPLYVESMFLQAG